MGRQCDYADKLIYLYIGSIMYPRFYISEYTQKNQEHIDRFSIFNFRFNSDLIIDVVTENAINRLQKWWVIWMLLLHFVFVFNKIYCVLLWMCRKWKFSSKINRFLKSKNMHRISLGSSRVSVLDVWRQIVLFDIFKPFVWLISIPFCIVSEIVLWALRIRCAPCNSILLRIFRIFCAIQLVLCLRAYIVRCYRHTLICFFLCSQNTHTHIHTLI